MGGLWVFIVRKHQIYWDTRVSVFLPNGCILPKLCTGTCTFPITTKTYTIYTLTNQGNRFPFITVISFQPFFLWNQMKSLAFFCLSDVWVSCMFSYAYAWEIYCMVTIISDLTGIQWSPFPLRPELMLPISENINKLTGSENEIVLIQDEYTCMYMLFVW